MSLEQMSSVDGEQESKDLPKEEEDLTCVKCSKRCDFGLHLPLIGSCLHLLCKECRGPETQGKIPCPLCAVSTKFYLAVERFPSISKREAMVAKTVKYYLVEDYGSDKPISVIVNSKHISFLPRIINKLDPASFIRFAKTCKTLHNVCFHSKGIRIKYDGLTTDSAFMCITLDDYNIGHTTHRPLSVRDITSANLWNYPFIFELSGLYIFSYIFDTVRMDACRAYLTTRFPRFTIAAMPIRYGHNDWNGLIRFVEDFKIPSVSVFPIDEDGEDPGRVPDEAAKYFLNGHVKDFYCHDIISEELVLNSTVPELHLRNFMVTSQDTLKTLILKSAFSTDDIIWWFGFDSVEFGHYELFKTLPFEFEETLPDERPLVLDKAVAEDAADGFYIMRTDGKLVYCYNDVENGLIGFTTDPEAFDELPPCVNRAVVTDDPVGASESDFI